MKKTFIFLALIAFAGSVLTSCKSHERCPAYGKVIKKESTERSV